MQSYLEFLGYGNKLDEHKGWKSKFDHIMANAYTKETETVVEENLCDLMAIKSVVANPDTTNGNKIAKIDFILTGKV